MSFQYLNKKDAWPKNPPLEILNVNVKRDESHWKLCLLSLKDKYQWFPCPNMFIKWVLQEFGQAKQRGEGMLKNHVSNIFPDTDKVPAMPLGGSWLLVSFHSCSKYIIHPRWSFHSPSTYTHLWGGLQTLGFLRHVRPSIVRIDPRSNCANRRHANPTPRTGWVLSMQPQCVYGRCQAHSGMLVAKTVSDLEGVRWRSRGPSGSH